MRRHRFHILGLLLFIVILMMGCEPESPEGATSVAEPVRAVVAPDTVQRRSVEGNVFTSTYLPPLRIEVDEALTYVGMMDFILKDIAQVERYVFVEADAGQRITRMVIFQLEGFLETTDEYYRYRFPDPLMLGGLAFNHNTWFYDDAAVIARNPEAESARTRAFLEEKGYHLDAALMMSRFVAVVDEAKRHELILFYIEPVRDTGYALPELATEGGDIRPEHVAIEDGLRQRSLHSMTIHAIPEGG